MSMFFWSFGALECSLGSQKLIVVYPEDLKPTSPTSKGSWFLHLEKGPFGHHVPPKTNGWNPKNAFFGVVIFVLGIAFFRLQNVSFRVCRILCVWGHRIDYLWKEESHRAKIKLWDWTCKVNGKKCHHSVDGWNPAPVVIDSLSPLITRLYTSQVVQDFFHQQYHEQLQCPSQQLISIFYPKFMLVNLVCF